MAHKRPDPVRIFLDFISAEVLLCPLYTLRIYCDSDAIKQYTNTRQNISSGEISRLHEYLK